MGAESLASDAGATLMANRVDVAYISGLLLASPVLLPRAIMRGRHRTDWRARLGHVDVNQSPQPGRRLLLHAVSVGEANAIRTLVDCVLASDMPPRVIIASTTETGFARAQELFADRCDVVRFPLDLSAAVRRFLDAVNPTVAAMVELELWPNFSQACERRGIPLVVVNGRLSKRSFAGYCRAKWFIRSIFRRVTCAMVQSHAYAKRFIALGVPSDCVHETGTMKWDTARIEDRAAVEGAEALANDMGIDRTQPLVVVGSSAPEEHALLEQAVGERAQLLCAPRRPEWFDAAARALPGCARRSTGASGSPTGRFLLDTMGELRKAYALADIVVIGRSFGALYGSDMMEPAALGVAVVTGPRTEDFAETVAALAANDGIVCSTIARLEDDLAALIADPTRRQQLADNAREVVRSNQGASQATADRLLKLLAEQAV